MESCAPPEALTRRDTTCNYNIVILLRQVPVLTRFPRGTRGPLSAYIPIVLNLKIGSGGGVSCQVYTNVRVSVIHNLLFAVLVCKIHFYLFCSSICKLLIHDIYMNYARNKILLTR